MTSTSTHTTQRRVAGGSGKPPATTLPAPTTGRTAVLVSVAVALFLMLAVPVREWFAQQAQIAELESQIAVTQEDLDGLREQRELWKDPAFIEQQARERLNYAKPGEVPLIVINSDDAPTGSSGTSGSKTARTWYSKLWLSVDAAAGRTDSEADTIKIRNDAPR